VCCELKVIDVIAGYKNIPIIGPVTFSAKLSDVVVVFGPNGVGKSTLIKTLATLLKPLRGKVLFNNKPIKKHKNSIFYLPEHVDLPLEITVLEYMRMYSALYSCKWSVEEAVRALDLFGLPPKALIKHLSQGQRRRLQLASALLVKNAVKMYLLDDPSIGLDDIAKEALLPKVITTLREGAIVIIATRDDVFRNAIKSVTCLEIDAVKISKVVSHQ
jgi:ABC-2 type transport system ATP-binding protein